MRKRRPLGQAITASVVLALLAVGILTPVGGGTEDRMIARDDRERVEGVDLSGFSADDLERELRLLFIHHSCGGQLLAEAGACVGEQGIYASHQNGGGLRERLGAAGYVVYEASYGSKIGQNTDWHHWPGKFADRMGQILACAGQDTSHADGERNDVVLFKSCFPSNRFVAEGEAPGSVTGEELTVWNARAAYASLLGGFAEHPDVLFVCLTPPPLAPKLRSVPAWKWLARKVLKRPGRGSADLTRSGEMARQFNSWLVAKDGWLADYRGTNVAVFDYYDLLTGEGRSNLSVHATGEGLDGHPSAEGNRIAAEALVPFLNRSVRRAGLLPGP